MGDMSVGRPATSCSDIDVGRLLQNPAPGDSIAVSKLGVTLATADDIQLTPTTTHSGPVCESVQMTIAVTPTLKSIVEPFLRPGQTIVDAKVRLSEQADGSFVLNLTPSSPTFAPRTLHLAAVVNPDRSVTMSVRDPGNDQGRTFTLDPTNRAVAATGLVNGALSGGYRLRSH